MGGGSGGDGGGGGGECTVTQCSVQSVVGQLCIL